MSSIEVIFRVLKGKPEAYWRTVLYTSLLSPPCLLSPLKTCKFIRPNVALAYTAFACTTLCSPYLCHSLCINLTNTISAIHSGWAPLTMLISKRTQCTLHLPSHLSEVHAAQPQKTRENNFPLFSPPPRHPHPFALGAVLCFVWFRCENSRRNFATCAFACVRECVCVSHAPVSAILFDKKMERGARRGEERNNRDQTNQGHDRDGEGETENMKRSPTVYSCNLCSLPRVSL